MADDGTLVGLTNDELDESLGVLRAMASSLGCKAQLRCRILVGDCQWLEDSGKTVKATRRLRTESLWVAEALISPDLDLDGLEDNGIQRFSKIEKALANRTPSRGNATQCQPLRTDQLRVSLTGSTTSGKSSLLGTLSTSTLDNGRGKSRLSLLKHRHEIASGVTSSVTGSLIGYHDPECRDNDETSGLQVINYASGNVSSWTDIHSASDPGRLVFLNDSAGHPRFRRTIIRGLVSWAPHWTLCCIAADNEEDTTGIAGATASASDVLGTSCAAMDLARAHLQLCLNLGLPLVVVITKLDLATMSALKPLLGKILSILKSAGRRPEVLSCPSDTSSFNSQLVNPKDEREVLRTLSRASGDEACSTVPIVLTSAVTGIGMDKLYALLRHLPIPQSLSYPDCLDLVADDVLIPRGLFHVDEIFAARETHQSPRQGSTDSSFELILSGHLRHGSLAVGQDVVIGPFASNPADAYHPIQEVHRANSYPRLKGSPKTNSTRRILPRPLAGDITTATRSSDEILDPAAVWRRVRICSIRNLRLPVHSLSSDQAGTVGLSLPSATANTDPAPLAPNDRIRKGMVMISLPNEATVNSLPAYNGFVAFFEATESSAFHPGMSVIAYMASIRAPAEILHSQTLQAECSSTGGGIDTTDGKSGSSGKAASDPRLGTTQQIKMTFQFLTYQEWFEPGSQVLVMPASPAGPLNCVGERRDKLSVGLEGLVGRIVRGLT